jgi:hypothetical protein
MQVTDKTFIYPHHLVREILCGGFNKNELVYIGRKGKSTTAGPISFAGVGSGYVLNSKLLAEFSSVWYVFQTLHLLTRSRTKCDSLHPAADVTVSLCLKNNLGVELKTQYCLHSSYEHDMYNKPTKFCSLYPVERSLPFELEDIYFSKCKYKGLPPEAKLVMGEFDTYDDEGW